MDKAARMGRDKSALICKANTKMRPAKVAAKQSSISAVLLIFGGWPSCEGFR